MPRKKSRSYPSFSLEEALSLSEMIYDVGGNSVAPVESILSKMDIKSNQNKRYTYKTSSAKQFGLIESKEGGFKVTQLAISILYPSSDNDPNVSTNKKRAAVKPELYKNILEQFNGTILPKDEFLINIFIQKGILSSVANKAVQAFLDTMKYANIMNEERRIAINKKYLDANFENKKIDVAKNTQDKRKNGTLSRIVNDTSSDEIVQIEVDQSKKVNETNSVFNLEIPLNSGKKAHIIIPNDVTLDEIKLIKNFIDAIKPLE